MLFFILAMLPLFSAHVCIHSNLNHAHFTANWTNLVETDYAPEPEFSAEMISPLSLGWSGGKASPRGAIRITTSTEDLFNPEKHCTAVGQLRPTFLGSEAICREEDILTPEKRDRLLHTVLPAAVSFFEKALSVDQGHRGLLMNNNICGVEISVPSNFTTTPGAENADYVLFVTAGPIESAETVAWAGACGYNRKGRPVVGLVNFGPAALGLPLAPQYFTKVATHEITHALGFTPYFAQSMFLWPNRNPISTRNRRGKRVTVITSPEVITRSREHFGCPTLDGMELEDGGGEGTQLSHWEKRLLLNELMVGMLNAGEVNLAVSNITLAFFQDSGHYNVNYTASSPLAEMRFGRSAGCSFLMEKCNTVGGGRGTHFCFNREKACAPDRLGVGVCNYVEYSSPLPLPFQYDNPFYGGICDIADYCPFVQAYDDYVCVNPSLEGLSGIRSSQVGDVFSSESRCFNTFDLDGTLKKGGLRHSRLRSSLNSTGQRCLRVRCVRGALQLSVGKSIKWLRCPANGSSGIIEATDGYSGRIECPPAEEICTPELEVYS